MGGSNINSNTLFVNSADPDGADNIFMTSDDGLRLNGGSPALHVGTSGFTAPLFDILNILRPQGAGYDMGAFEQ